MSTFVKATKRQAKLRMAITGPAGAGKTYTTLRVATALGGPIAMVDTEHGSASKYADEFVFDVLELNRYAPADYVAAIRAAEGEGYNVLIIDSLTHAWTGKEGALEMADKAAARQGENRFTAWRHVTPEHNGLIEAILGAHLHVIATMRSKMDYDIQRDDHGKTTVKKLGMAPIQRAGIEYEFDIVGDMDTEDNTMVISKTRCRELTGKVYIKPGKDLADTLAAWLTDGAPAYDRQARAAYLKTIRAEIEGMGQKPPTLTAKQVMSYSESELEAEIGMTEDQLQHYKEVAAHTAQPATA